MTYKKLIAGIILMFLTVLPMAFAINPFAYYEKGNNIALKIPCFKDNSFCSNTAECGLVVVDPYSNIIVNNASVNVTSGYTSYNITSNLIVFSGEYQVFATCNDNGEVGKDTLSFVITEENANGQNNQALIIGLGIVMFFLLYLSINVGKEHFILSFVMMALSIWILPLIPKAVIWGESAILSFYNLTWWVVIIFYTYATFYLLWKVWLKKYF